MKLTEEEADNKKKIVYFIKQKGCQAIMFDNYNNFSKCIKQELNILKELKTQNNIDSIIIGSKFYENK